MVESLQEKALNKAIEHIEAVKRKKDDWAYTICALFVKVLKNEDVDREVIEKTMNGRYAANISGDVDIREAIEWIELVKKNGL